VAKVLIIDDDEGICQLMSDCIKLMGHQVQYSQTLNEGLRAAATGIFDVIYLDVKLPDGNGLQWLPKFRKVVPATEVIIITGLGDHADAESAIDNGAWDYIEKPSAISLMINPLKHILQYKEIHKGDELPFTIKRNNIIGNSRAINASLQQVAQVAKSNSNVLLTGETGTGKELFAWAIHHNSARANENFVIVDCTILTETLVEEILFGHEKGAFTGADKIRAGLIAQADGGTIFLDEIGELPYSVQKKFLRVLQEHRFRPLGSKNEMFSNFRLIAATNRNLNKMAELGQFRKDLLFRLRSFSIELPPLRKRLEDIPDLVAHKLNTDHDYFGSSQISVSPEYLDALKSYDWPGNVRELFNTIERSLSVCNNNSVLFPRDLPKHIRIKLSQDHVGKKDNGLVIKTAKDDINIVEEANMASLQYVRDTALAKIEKAYLHELKIVSANNFEKACSISGLSRSRLYALLKKHEIRFSYLADLNSSVGQTSEQV
jgi:two-component system NtrC family response regulator